MKDFRSELDKLMEGYDKPRPFICGGNPLECEIFIVGINAATEMESNFWAFGSDSTGFDKKAWLEAYILEPNKIRRNKLSNTRQRLEWLVEAINPLKTLETNLFVKPTESAKELNIEDRESLIFEYLIQKIKPKIIFTHGKEVREYLERLYGIAIVPEKINIIELLGIKTKIVSMSHLSRGWSKKKTIETGEFLKELAKGELQS
jgi:hypothetical protein